MTNNFEENVPRTKQFKLLLTPNDHLRLKRRAIKTDRSMNDYILDLALSCEGDECFGCVHQNTDESCKAGYGAGPAECTHWKCKPEILPLTKAEFETLLSR